MCINFVSVAKRIEPDLYDDFLTTDFGQQEVTQLQLCSMQRKSKSGYYQVEHVVNFGRCEFFSFLSISS